MVFSKEVTPDNFYVIYLHIINGLLRLTEKEILVLAEFLRVKDFIDKTQGFLTPEEKSKMLFGSVSRKALQKKLELSQFSLNNYIKSLKEKKLIQEKGRKLYINPLVYIKKEPKTTKIEFKLIDANESTEEVLHTRAYES